MKTIPCMWSDLKNREDGQTLSEYGIILFFLVLIVIGAVTFFSENVMAMWEHVVETFDLI